MSEFKIGEIVKGRVCGTFKIKAFDKFQGRDIVLLKEVHPVDHREGPHPKLAFTMDMIRKLDGAQ